MNVPAMQTIHLARGAHHLVPVRPGTLILVRRGSVRLRPPPEWPAYTFADEMWRLDPEETYAATANGHAELIAIDNAQVVLIEKARARLFEKFGKTLCQIVQTVRAPRRPVRKCPGR